MRFFVSHIFTFYYIFFYFNDKIKRNKINTRKTQRYMRTSLNWFFRIILKIEITCKRLICAYVQFMCECTHSSHNDCVDPLCNERTNKQNDKIKSHNKTYVRVCVHRNINRNDEITGEKKIKSSIIVKVQR